MREDLFGDRLIEVPALLLCFAERAQWSANRQAADSTFWPQANRISDFQPTDSSGRQFPWLRCRLRLPAGECWPAELGTPAERTVVSNVY